MFDQIQQTNRQSSQAGATTASSKGTEFDRVPEILAPVGGREQFFAALNAGADAVFLGLKQFNARSRAENFTIDDLAALVPLAHHFDMKVLVTLNILLKTSELNDLIRTLADLENVGVDAIIVQDLGVARLARRYFPSLRLHASTQLAVHNTAGALQAAALGFKRVVVAREMTATELRRMRRDVPREVIEIEAFCHGSLCYSYSGLCFFSGAQDARSGNRGECAYTCRKPYKILNEPGHGFLFSMRDLDTSRDLELFLRAGVDTLKIEGRKKDAQYVASVVRLYRRMLDEAVGYSTLRPKAPQSRGLDLSEAQLREQLQLSFQRQATSFFVKGRYHENVIDLDNPTHVGVLAGTVSRVKGRMIHLRTLTPLDRFDGLRLSGQQPVFHSRPQHGHEVAGDISQARQKYENAVPQFSLRQMMIAGKPVFSCPFGVEVAIEVPPQLALPQVGDQIFKVRSDALRQRTEQDTRTPPEYRLRPLIPVTTRVIASRHGHELHLLVRVEKAGALLGEASFVGEWQDATSWTVHQDRMIQHFRIWGDIGFYSEDLRLEGEAGWHLADRDAKGLKRRLADILVIANGARMQRQVALALSDVASSNDVAGLAVRDDSSLVVKFDRPEYIRYLVEILSAPDGLPIREIVFEPKKAMLGGVTVMELAREMEAFTRRFHIPFRLAIPTVVRDWDKPLLHHWVKGLQAVIEGRFEVGNIGAWQLLNEWGLTGESASLTGDFTLYGLNPMAVAALHDLNIKILALSIEDDQTNMADNLKHGIWCQGILPQAILFKDTPLFIGEACSLTALHNGCPTAKVCGYRTLHIENDAGERFYVGHESCKSIVYGEDAYSIASFKSKLEELGVRNFRIDFLTRPYTRERFQEVLFLAWAGQKVPGTHTANFARSLL